LATQNKKFVIKNGLAVGGASGIIDIVDSNGTWIGATGILHGATGPAGSNGATGVSVQGASGPSGATGIIQNWTLKTTTYTAVNKDSIAADTTGGAFTITLPATPSAGHSITIADSGHSFNTNNLTIARNGSTIETQSQDLVVDIANVIVSLIYDGTTWKVFSTVGIQGASGATGSAGTNGTNGATGSAGTNGATGAAGTNGTNGATGVSGATGPQGIQGASGATGIQGASGVTGSAGATGAGVQGASGATGIQGPAGQSSSYYSYKAKTTSQSGDPGNGYITWNNATILSANTLQVSHLTNDSFDIDIFLTIVSIGDTLIIQEATDSARFQKWQVTGTPIVFTNQHYEYPVTLLDSGGTAITNNDNLILAVVSTPVDGATGPAGTNGATGSQGVQGASGAAGTNGATGVSGATGTSGSNGTNGATGIQGASGVDGASGFVGSNGATGAAGAAGATGSAGSNGTNGATGPTGATGVGTSGATGIIQNWIVKTTTYTAVNKDAIAANTSGGAFTITLPAAPSTGDSVTFADSGHSFNTNNLTVGRNGSTIESSATDLVLDVSNVFVSLIYNGTTWKAFSTVGVQGASGISGASGFVGSNGATGAAGATGSAGSNGTNGATGSAGTNGATGVSGVNGATGPQGINGATGSAGVNGATGSAGVNGASGFVGSNGATGAAGTNGATGATGIIGGVESLGASGSYYPVLAGSTGPLSAAYLNTNYTFNPGTGVFSTPFVNATGTITGSLTSGAISYGTLNYSDVNLMASFASSVNTYNQVLLQNGSNGTSASANFVVSNDLATNSTNYGDFGMNSSGFNGGSDCEFHKANTVYLAAQSADLAIGTYGTNNVHFIVNNSVVESMTINANTSIQVNSPLKVTTGATGFTGATGAVGAPSAYFNSLYVNGTAVTGGAGGASITDDTTTNASYYPAMYSVTTGSPATVYTSSSKIYFNPSTGTLNSTIYNSLSDENKKKNIKTIGNAIDTVNQLNGVEFDWKDTGVKSYGVIAQEIEKVLPDLVTMDDQGNKSVNYNGLFGFLINAIKEQQKQIDDLKGKN